MFTRRPRTARELVLKVGRVPALAASATLGMAMIPAMAWAGPVDGQSPGGSGGASAAPAPAENSIAAVPGDQAQADAPAIRDPMKADKPAKQPANDDKGKAKVSVSEHMTVDLHLKDEDLSNVLELLSIQTQKNIVASKGVTGKVTATLYGVTFYQALDAILHVNGFGYVENGNFIFVYTNDELKGIQAALKKRISKTITLNYLNADDAKEFITPLLSKDGGEVKVNAKTKDFTIPDKAPVGKNDYALSDRMVVFDYEENVKAIEELVKQLDTRPQQVLVEAMILQTSLNEANAFGVDFSIVGDVNFLDFINTGGALSAANSLIKGGTGATGQGLSPTSSPATGVTSTVGNTASGPAGFKVGVVAGDVGIFVRMLDQITDTVILSNPKILALNRQPARVLVGKRVGYLNTTQTETSTTQSVEFLDTGTQLYFRPFVSNDGDIRMELKPQVSSAEIRTITGSNGQALTIPDEDTQEMVTNVDIRDGQTVVLGGLFTDNTTFTKQQVPWVGDLPIIGAAFRGHDDSIVRSEIIFMITPTIVTDTMIAGAAERASADLERVRAGTRQGLLSFSREKMTDQANVEAEQLANSGKYEEALHKLQYSLSLNPTQIEAYRLRDKITGMKEHWTDPSMLNSYLDSEVAKRLDNVPTSSTPQEHMRPWGSTTVPMEKAVPPTPMKGDAGSSQNKGSSSAISLPGQGNALPVTVAAGETVNISTPGSMTSPNAPSGWDNSAKGSPAANTGAPNSNPAGNSAMDSLAQSMAMQSMTGAAPAGSAPAAATSFAAAGNVTIGQSSSEQSYTVPLLSPDELKASDQVRAALPGLRGQIDLFSLMNSGQVPQLGSTDNNGWTDLVNAQLLKDVPANPYVGGPNASKVVVGEKPDDTFQTNYGWIFNPKTHNLWAAGFDAKDRPLSKTPTATAGKPATTNVQPAAPATPAPATAGVETDNQNK